MKTREEIIVKKVLPPDSSTKTIYSIVTLDLPKHLMINFSLMVPKNKFQKKLCLSFLLELLYVYKFLKMSVIMISSTHLRDD